MGVLYPKALDRFRPYVDDFDHMVAADLKDLFDVAVQIQTELGIKPSGDLGTVYGRLFAAGNISETTGLWQRLLWEPTPNLRGNQFWRQSFSGYALAYNRARFDGMRTTWGDGIPAAFGAAGGPLNHTAIANTNGRAGVPWRSALAVVTESTISWIAQDGAGNKDTLAVPRDPDLHTGNSANGVSWNFLLWALFT